MINVAIGTATPKMLWRPILEQLIERGVVNKTEVTTQSVKERTQAYSIYHLASNPYTYKNNQATA
jgi:hypothetical protein